MAGVSATSSVQFLVLGFCTGLCSGFGVPVARSFGANQFGRMKRYFHGALLTAVIAVILTTGCVLLLSWILKMLSVTEDICSQHSYLHNDYFPWTAIYTFVQLPVKRILRAVGDSRTPFLFLAFSACLNVVLDLICIIVFK